MEGSASESSSSPANACDGKILCSESEKKKSGSHEWSSSATAMPSEHDLKGEHTCEWNSMHHHGAFPKPKIMCGFNFHSSNKDLGISNNINNSKWQRVYFWSKETAGCGVFPLLEHSACTTIYCFQQHICFQKARLPHRMVAPIHLLFNWTGNSLLWELATGHLFRLLSNQFLNFHAMPRVSSVNHSLAAQS